MTRYHHPTSSSVTRSLWIRRLVKPPDESKSCLVGDAIPDLQLHGEHSCGRGGGRGLLRRRQTHLPPGFGVTPFRRSLSSHPFVVARLAPPPGQRAKASARMPSPWRSSGSAPSRWRGTSP